MIIGMHGYLGVQGHVQVQVSGSITIVWLRHHVRLADQDMYVTDGLAQEDKAHETTAECLNILFHI